MNNFKKSSYFTKVEDKYVFQVSTAFWHLLIGLITIAAIGGILLFLWSVIPASKNSVNVQPYPQRPVFPPVEKVNLTDLNLNEEKVQPQPNIVEALPVYTPPKPEVQVAYDPDKPAYDLALEGLRKIIPENQWKPGQWEITNQLGWDMYHSDQYRRWVPTGNNIEDYLESIYRSIDAKKYKEKKSALESVTKIVNAMPADIKGIPVQYVSNSVNSDWKDLKLFDSLCSEIAKNVTFFGKETANATERMTQFGFNEQNSAFEFIPFVVKTSKQFSDSLRFSVFSTLASSYYNYFNKNVEIQKDATEQFNELIPQLHGINPAKALKKFYSIFNQKNKDRNVSIARMMNDYELQINSIIADSARQAMQAEITYIEKQGEKKDLRWKSLQAVGGGFVAIALLGTILTLLSIQRILKRIEIFAEKGNSSPVLPDSPPLVSS